MIHHKLLPALCECGTSYRPARMERKADGVEEMKQRRASSGEAAPFEKIAPQIANIHDHLVAELSPRPGEEWLDVGTDASVAVTASVLPQDVER